MRGLPAAIMELRIYIGQTYIGWTEPYIDELIATPLPYVEVI